MEFRTKILILGSGPAGCSAAIYAARANLNPLMVCGIQPGGQLTITTDVENYPGFADVIQGPWLMDQMTEQAKKVGTEIITDYIVSTDLSKRPFTLKGASGDEYITDCLVICTGAEAKWLGLESEKKFQGFGVSGCATCDGFFFKQKEVAVIGGGNTAVEEAIYLTKHASKVTIIHRRDNFRAEKLLQQKLFSNPKIKVLWNSTLEEVHGTENPKSVNSITLSNTLTSEKEKLAVDGVFIAIGHKPNTDLFKHVLDMDDEGYIQTVKGTTKTNIEGVYAAGDVQDKIYRQAVTAAGTGCMAALEAEKFLSM